MSSDWEEISIDDLKADKNNAIAMGPFGSRIKKENFTDSGIPVIKGGNLNGDFILEDDFDYLTIDKADELSTSNAFRRDIVITHRGTIGQVGIIPDNSKHERYVVSQSQLKVSLDESRVNSYFVYYFLRAPIGQHRLLSNASQVGVPAIAQASTSVKSILVPVPKIEVQDKIVEILLSLDHKIEANKQINETLEAMAQAIFKSWFVDFDPVRAKIEAKSVGRDPNRVAMAVIAGISLDQDWDEVEFALDQKLSNMTEEQRQQLTRTAELFPDELEESEIGEVPKGWEVVELKKVIKNYDRKRVPLSRREREERPGDYPYYGATSIMDYVDDYLFDGRNVLMAEDGSVMDDEGKPVLQYVDGKIWVNNHAHVLNGKGPISNEILYLFLQTVNVSPYVTGAVQKKINQGNMNSIPFLLCDEKLYDFLSPILKGFFDKIIQNEKENEELEKLRDTLLPKLISGEVEV